MDRTTAIRVLLGSAMIGLIAQAWLFRTALGLNAVLLTAVVLVTAAAVAAGSGRLGAFDLLDGWIPVSAVLVATGIALRSEPTLVFLDAVTGATLLAASMAAFAGAVLTRRSTLAIVGLGTIVLAWVLVGILRFTPALRQPLNTTGWRSRIPGGAVPVARGIVIAVPLLLVFVALFASADAIFASRAAALFDWHVDLSDAPMRVALAFVVAWAVAGLLAVAAGAAGVERDSPAPGMQSLGAAVAEPIPLHPRLGVTESVTILVAVDLLFATFVGLQLAYLFGGLDTLAAGGITYANYARHGFFELVAVTILAGGLVVVLQAIVARRTRMFVGAAIGLAALTGVVLVSAALRLRLYQDAYGWTELRFYIAASIGWLGIGIVAATLLLLRDRMRWLPHAMMISAVAVLLVVNVIGPQRHVAGENVARLLDSSRVPADGRPGLDVSYASTLGDDAVPALVAALPALAPEDRAWLTEDLRRRWAEVSTADATAWPAWSLARQRAREALVPLFGQ